MPHFSMVADVSTKFFQIQFLEPLATDAGHGKILTKQQNR